MRRKPSALPGIERLEPRILLSADALGALGLDAAANDLEQKWQQSFDFGGLSQQLKSFTAHTPTQAVSTVLEAASTPSDISESVLNLFDFSQNEPLDSAVNHIESVLDDWFERDFFNDATTQDDQPLELILIDAATPDYQTLLDDITARDQERQYLVFILDSQQDGIEQISDILAQYQQVDALHLISHGAAGSLQLGNAELSQQSLGQYQQALLGWRNALASDADLLIYGCDLAANESGQRLIQSLAWLTGADIAASDDLTGAQGLGGDWELEYQLGQITSQIAFSAHTQSQWSGTLATFTVNTTTDTVDVNPGDGVALDSSGNTSLRAAIMEANALAGADEIVLNAGTYTLSITGNDDNAAKGDLDVKDDLSIKGAGAGATIINANGIDRVIEVRDGDTDLSLSKLTVTGGSVSGDGGGIHIQNAAATLSTNQVIISNNLANKGAGIFNKGTLTMTDSVVSNNGNGSTDLGGGISNKSQATLERVTISGNHAKDGGGLHQDGSATSFKLTNVTVSGNTADGKGGGFFVQKDIVILSSTFSNNSAGTDGGGIKHEGGSINIKNSIVAGNTAGGNGPDVHGSFSSLGFNLIGNTSGASGFIGSDITGVSANLSALANNGGFGQTHALLVGSPAINPAGLTGAALEDGRNFARDGTPDIGAFEFGAGNDDPTLDNAISDQAATQGSAFNFTFAANTFSDADGDTLTYTAEQTGLGSLPAWLSFNASTRTFSGTPGNADVGSHSITVTASDGNGGTNATDTFIINVANINDAPTLSNSIPNQAATEDSAFNFTFAANTFADVDVGDTLTYSAQVAGGGALPSWLSFNAGTRTFSGTPLNADVGTLALEVIANDGNGGSVTSNSFNLVVSNSNDAPTLANSIPNQAATEDNAFSFAFAANTFADVDVGDTLTYSAQVAGGGALPSWLSFNAGTRTFSGTPLNADVGTLALEVIANDGNGGSVTSNSFNLVVSNSNDAPTLANSIPNQAATEDSAFSFAFAANTFADVDVGDTLTYSAQVAGGGALPSWLSFNAGTRTFSGTPLNADVGTLALEVIANDGNGGSVTSNSFNLVVSNTNDDPTVANSIPNQNATKNTAFSFTFAADSFEDVDAGDTLTYSAQLSGGGALPGWLSFNAGTRTFSGTPGNLDVGTISIEVTASDGRGGTDATDTFDLQVKNSNISPVLAVGISNQTATEDSPFNFTFGAGTFTDADGDALTYTATLSGGGALPGWLSFNAATRAFSGTPLNADVGSLSIEVTANDNNGGSLISDTFTLTIGNSNDDPTLDNSIADQSASEDSAFTYNLPLNTFSDVDVGDSLTLSAQLASGAALPGWLSFNAASGTFSGTPSNADVGTLSIKVIADDGKGGTPANDIFDLVIANTNDDPTLVNPIPDQSATKHEAFSLTFAAGTFSDVDLGDSLTYSAEQGNGSALPAWLNFNAATRTFSGTPGNGDLGTLSIKVIADDGKGGTPASSLFDLQVLDKNLAPQLNTPLLDQNALEDSPFKYSFAANTFTDADADLLSYKATLADGSALPAWLSFDSSTRTFSGTPGNDDVGVLKVLVSASDGKVTTPVTSSFTLTVSNTNDDPLAGTPLINQQATENQAFSYSFGADSFTDEDAGATLTLQASLADGAALPAWLSFDATSRTFSGTPDLADVGTLTIKVLADDGQGGTPAEQQFQLSIQRDNQDPLLANGLSAQTALEDTGFSFTLPSGTFSDADGDPLSLSVSGLPAWLTYDAATQTLSGTPGQADVGHLVLSFIADDGQGGTPASAALQISVLNVNDAPTGSVWIDGTAGVGKTLSAQHNLADADGLGSISYQWLRDGVVISGATDPSYALTSKDAGHSISVSLNYVDGQGTQESASSPKLLLPAEISTPATNNTNSSTTSTAPEPEAPPPAPPTAAAEPTAPAAPATEPVVEESAEQHLLFEESLLQTSGSDLRSHQSLNVDRSQNAVSETGQIDRPQTHESTLFALNDETRTTSELEIVGTLQVNFSPMNDPTHLVTTQDFVRGIDQLREELAQQSKLSKTFVGSSFAISAGMSAGYVIWLARSGVLLSGVLSALPAWRFIDPLPVLASSGSLGDEDGETLESLVDTGGEPDDAPAQNQQEG